MYQFKDTIPDVIGPGSPVLAPGSTVEGWFEHGRYDTEVWRIDLEPGQSYRLDLTTTRFLSEFRLLDVAGTDLPDTFVRYRPGSYDTAIPFYERAVQTTLRVNEPTTLLFAASGGHGTAHPYTLTFETVAGIGATVEDNVLKWDDAIAHYEGGPGTDTLSFAALNSAVSLDLGIGELVSDAIDVTPPRTAIGDVERIEGTSFDDIMMGDYFGPRYGPSTTTRPFATSRT